MTLPKKPLAVSRAKKKLPVELDWGPGVPKDRLAYINADEKALIQRFRKTKAAREYAGVPAFASDSASSKGVERGADGPSGVGRGSGSGGSSTSSSSSGSKSTSSSSSTSGGGNKSASGTSTQSAATSKPSSAPNAAAQAASNKLNASQTSARGPVTNAGASGSVSRPSVSTSNSGAARASAPNAAAAAASSKLNATANAIKSASQPQSIQGMINSQRTAPVGSATVAEKLVKDAWFNSQLGSMYKDPAISVNLPNALKEGMWNQRISDSTRVAQGKQPIGSFGERQLAPDPGSGFRTKEQAAQNVLNGTGIAHSFHNFGLAADIFPSNFPGYGKPGYKAWENSLPAANADLAKNIPDSYGIKWGGSFGDPAHFQVGSGSMKTASKAAQVAAANGSVVTQEGVRPGGRVASTASYGNDGVPQNTALAASKPPVGASTGLQAALDSWNVPKPGSIPTPNGQTVASSIPSMQNYPPTPHFGPPMPSSGIATAPLGPITRDPAAARMTGIQQAPQTMVAGDPRVSMPPGSLAPRQAPVQQTPQTMVAGDPRVSMPPGSLAPRQAPVQQAATVPQGPLPSALPGFKPPGLPGNFRGTAGQAYTYNAPSNWSPQVAAGDAVPEDGPVYSDNPIQGSVNPMQEGPQVEDPGVTKQRQNKYASTGATIGSVIAGPLGAVVGGTLGWQMGKTSPQQRQAIASNPKAVQANVQSINQMVEERGGKGNPQMRVTEAGFRDVLTNPQKVTQNPENYTTLEQMLAALAQGIDPETGKPIA